MNQNKKRVRNTISNLAVDSTLPVKALLTKYVKDQKLLSLVHRRIMTKAGLPDTLRPHCLQPGHPTSTFPAEWDGVLPRNLYIPFEYKSTLPTIMTNARNIGISDPVLEHMKTKEKWRRLITTLKMMGRKETKNGSGLTQANDKVLHCSKIIADLTVCLEEDPYPYFESSYNWHYAGNGNLQVLAVGDEDCLLHSDLCRLYLSKFSRRRIRVKRKFMFCYDCGEGNNILETICNGTYIALRFMYKVFILKLIEKEGKLGVKKIKEIEYKQIVTGISFDAHHKSILYITKLDNECVIVNLDIMRGRTIKLHETKSLVDNWGTTMSLDSNAFCHVGRETITIYDKRSNNIVHKWKEGINSFEHCDKFNVAKKCDASPLMYVGTRHHIFLADLRLKTKFVQRWTPMTNCEPTYLSLCAMEDGKDLICLSSQWPEDVCVVTNNSNSILRKGYNKHMYMPLQLPSVDRALLQARQKFMCTDPYNAVDERVYTALTGCAVVEADDDYLVLTQNALGDIFCNTLYTDKEVEDDSVARLHEWSKTLKDLSRSYDVTDIADIADFWKKLRKVPRDYKIGGDKVWQYLPLGFDAAEAARAFEGHELDAGLATAWEHDAPAALPLDLDFSDCE